MELGSWLRGLIVLVNLYLFMFTSRGLRIVVDKNIIEKEQVVVDSEILETLPKKRAIIAAAESSASPVEPTSTIKNGAPLNPINHSSSNTGFQPIFVGTRKSTSRSNQKHDNDSPTSTMTKGAQLNPNDHPPSIELQPFFEEIRRRGSNETKKVNRNLIPFLDPSSKPLVKKLSRVFSIWNHAKAYSWCTETVEPNAGLLFVKVPKCASSNGMGVTLRIADTLGRRKFPRPGSNTTKACPARYRHGYAAANDNQYDKRLSKKSALWSMLRHPASRLESAYFFYQVSRRNQEATEEGMLNYMNQTTFKSFLIKYLRLKKYGSREEEIHHLIHNYDFLGISERMEESMVVLAMLLRVPLTDVVVLNSKTSGGYDDGRTHKGCVKLKPKFTTPRVDEFLRGDFLRDNADYLLYQAANISLDRTIEKLGRDKVTAGVLRYRRLTEDNEMACRQKAIYPCPITLQNHAMQSKKDCYFSDAGCGHKCTDEALRKESDGEWARFQAEA